MPKNLLLMTFMLTACTSAHMIKLELWPSLLSQKEIRLYNEKKSYGLLDIYDGHKAAVVIFWQPGCPCVKRYKERVKKLFERYGSEIAFFYVLSNQSGPLDKAILEYNRRKEPFPLLVDEGGQLAQALTIKGTPSAALIDKKGEVAFLGWIDNERDIGEKGRKAYLENAIIELLSGLPIKVKTSPMFGCPIR